MKRLLRALTMPIWLLEVALSGVAPQDRCPTRDELQRERRWYIETMRTRYRP